MKGWRQPSLRKKALGPAVVACLLAAIGVTIGVLWRRAQLGKGTPSFDIYEAFYPNIVYTLESLKRGHGLLWNRFQNCGQPFLPATIVGLFYPLYLIFLAVGIPTGLLVLAVLHLTIAGIGTYLLCREIGLDKISSLCGAFCFEISGNVVALAAWQPGPNLGVYAWMPMALFLCERALRAPRLGTGLLLGAVLTLQLLLANPQALLFTYQLIALRVAWEFLTANTRIPRHALATLSVGLVLPVFLGAAQLLPMAEFAHESLRNGPLPLTEMKPGASYVTWRDFRAMVGGYWARPGITPDLGTPFVIVAAALSALVLLGRRHRRIAWFYLLASALFLTLAFDSPLFRLYRELPLGSWFRYPERFIWVTGFTFSVVTACGSAALEDVAAFDGPLSWLALVAPVLGGALFYLLSAFGLRPWEWLLLVGVVIMCAGVLWHGKRAQVARVGLLALLVGNLAAVNSEPVLGYLKDGSELYEHADAFAFVKQRLTLQDRVYQIGRHVGLKADFSLMPKSASIFRVPSVVDYEPQTSRRYAALAVKLILGPQAHPSLNAFYYFTHTIATDAPLLDLLAARFLIVDTRADHPGSVIGPPLRLLWEKGVVRVYENPAALPRTFYVPRVVVTPDPDMVAQVVASARTDLRRVAFVEEKPRDGFTGGNTGSGTATIESDYGEEVRVRVDATADGFLFLADQFYPGWEVTVNGRPVPIMRANYAFRLVRVPAGESIVIFRYRPTSVRLGIAVSCITLAVLILYAGARFARRARQ